MSSPDIKTIPNDQATDSATQRLTFLQGLAALGVALAGGVVVAAMNYGIVYVGYMASIFIGLIYGRFLGSLIKRAAGHKSNLALEIITGAGVLVSGVGAFVASRQMNVMVERAKVAAGLIPDKLPHTNLEWAVLYFNPIAMLTVLLTVIAAVSCFRFDGGLTK